MGTGQSKSKPAAAKTKASVATTAAAAGWPRVLTDDDIWRAKGQGFVVKQSSGGVVKLSRGGWCIEYKKRSGSGSARYDRMNVKCGVRGQAATLPAVLVGKKKKTLLNKLTRGSGGRWTPVSATCPTLNCKQNERISKILAGKMPRPPAYDPYGSENGQWDNDDTMFFWIMNCYDENNYASKTCTRAREFFPWPSEFKKAPARVTQAQKRRRIFPNVNCTYGDLWYKPECESLLAKVGGNRQSVRSRRKRKTRKT